MFRSGHLGLGPSPEHPDCDELTVPSGSASSLNPCDLGPSVHGVRGDPNALTSFSSRDDVLCHPPPRPSEEGE